METIDYAQLGSSFNSFEENKHTGSICIPVNKVRFVNGIKMASHCTYMHLKVVPSWECWVSGEGFEGV